MIFDMDGVITDEARYWQVSRKLSRELTGNEISSSFIRKMKNSGVNSNWEILYKFHKLERTPEICSAYETLIHVESRRWYDRQHNYDVLALPRVTCPLAITDGNVDLLNVGRRREIIGICRPDSKPVIEKSKATFDDFVNELKKNEK